jgi:hypothetical protein
VDLRPYVVRQGDTLAKLAYMRGFDATAVWNEAKNDRIRALRPDMDLLAPDDIVYLPQPRKSELAIVKGTTNRYVASVPKVTMHLVIHDEDGNPLVGEPYEIRGLGDPVPGAVGDGGAVTFDARITDREVTLVFTQRGLVYPVRIGDLDPIEETSGVRMRLEHLGYLRSSNGEDPMATERAIAALQEAQTLAATGILDDTTREALRKAHGS